MPIFMPKTLRNLGRTQIPLLLNNQALSNRTYFYPRNKVISTMPSLRVSLVVVATCLMMTPSSVHGDCCNPWPCPVIESGTRCNVPAAAAAKKLLQSRKTVTCSRDRCGDGTVPTFYCAFILQILRSRCSIRTASESNSPHQQTYSYSQVATVHATFLGTLCSFEPIPGPVP